MNLSFSSHSQLAREDSVKKIFAVIGSPNNVKSNTATMVKDFCESVQSVSPGVEWELVSLGEKRVEFCRGC